MHEYVPSTTRMIEVLFYAKLVADSTIWPLFIMAWTVLFLKKPAAAFPYLDWTFPNL